MLNNETFSFIISLFGLISLELIIENCPWLDRNINYSSRLIKWKEKLSRLTLAIIHKICRNSHFRASKIQNFLRPPTMVANIFYIILASPLPHFWNGHAVRVLATPSQHEVQDSNTSTKELLNRISLKKTTWIPTWCRRFTFNTQNQGKRTGFLKTKEIESTLNKII